MNQDNDAVLKALVELSIEMGKRFDRVDERFDTLERRIERVEVKSDETHQGLRTLRTELAARFAANP